MPIKGPLKISLLTLLFISFLFPALGKVSFSYIVLLIASTDTTKVMATESHVPKTLKKSPNNKKIALINHGPLPVRAKLDPESPILGMANRGSFYPIVTIGKSWCTIRYKEQNGWVLRSSIDIVDEVDKPSSSIVLKDLVLVGSIIGGLIIFLLIIRLLSNHNSVKSEWFSTAKMTKNVLIVSNKKTNVPRFLTNNTTPFQNCFTEIGFTVTETHDSKMTMEYIHSTTPDAIAVDWQLGQNTQAIIEQILFAKASTINLFVLFYNVPDIVTVKKSINIKNAQYLGLSFTDRELFDIITPFIINEDQDSSSTKSTVISALQGEIGADNLMEVFQFIEIGRKTGCLMIKNEKPSGIVYFNDGIIIFAATQSMQARKSMQAKKAVFEILGMNSGQFDFVIGKAPKTPNCTIPTLGILMEWTKERDENTGR